MWQKMHSARKKLHTVTASRSLAYFNLAQEDRMKSGRLANREDYPAFHPSFWRHVLKLINSSSRFHMKWLKNALKFTDLLKKVELNKLRSHYSSISVELCPSVRGWVWRFLKSKYYFSEWGQLFNPHLPRGILLRHGYSSISLLTLQFSQLIMLFFVGIPLSSFYMCRWIQSTGFTCTTSWWRLLAMVDLG